MQTSHQKHEAHGTATFLVESVAILRLEFDIEKIGCLENFPAQMYLPYILLLGGNFCKFVERV